MGEEEFFFFFEEEARLSHFVIHIERRHRGPEVKLYWWAELNFGQEPAFLAMLFWLTKTIKNIF